MNKTRTAAPKVRGATTLTNDERDFLLRGHDWFNRGFAEQSERMRHLWQMHSDELMAMWNAPRGNFPPDEPLPSNPHFVPKLDPLHWCDHGPHIKTYGELHFDKENEQ